MSGTVAEIFDLANLRLDNLAQQVRGFWAKRRKGQDPIADMIPDECPVCRKNTGRRERDVTVHVGARRNLYFGGPPKLMRTIRFMCTNGHTFGQVVELFVGGEWVKDDDPRIKYLDPTGDELQRQAKMARLVEKRMKPSLWWRFKRWLKA